ncbi:MAG: ABC transporter permease [Clostridia bacterium]|nr:ABC transporter permease [Clostridia bacterium]
MIKLLRGNLARTIKSKTFWICIALYAAYAICLPIVLKYQNPEFFNGTGTSELLLATGYGIAGFPLQGMFIATICCIIFGADFHNGTLRNKLIIGQTRNKIYIANLLASLMISLVLNLVYLLFFFIISLPMCGGFTAPSKDIIQVLIYGLLMMFSYSAISTFIVMTSKNTTVAIIISFVLLFVSMMLIMYFDEVIQQTPYYTQYTMNEYGEIVEQVIANPHMPSKSLVNFSQFMLDCFPSGQSFLLSNNNVIRWQMPIYSLSLIAITSGTGLLIFNKTNIK